MMKNLTIGLVAGAVAVVALALSRPQMPSIPPFRGASGRVEGLAPLPSEPPAWAQGVPARPPVSRVSRPATQPGPTPLDRMIDEVRFENTPLEEVIGALAAKADVNVIVEWPALEAAAIDKATPVTLRLKRVPLRRVLDAVAGSLHGERLGYCWRDTGVLVSTRVSIAQSSVMTRVYDIRDLMVEAWHVARRFVPKTVDPAGGNSSGAPADLLDPATEASLSRDVSRAICNSVDPESWREGGGLYGAMDYWAGRLIITNTPENHEKIESLLRKMRGEE